MASLSNILKNRIGREGKSKAYVASQLGVSERTVENYINGTRQPKPDVLIKLGEILGFSLEELSGQNVPTAVPKQAQDYKDKYISLLEKQNEETLNQIKEGLEQGKINLNVLKSDLKLQLEANRALLKEIYLILEQQGIQKQKVKVGSPPHVGKTKDGQAKGT